MFQVYALAEVLGKTVSEIEQMTVTEFNGWLAYFHIKNEDRDGKQAT